MNRSEMITKLREIVEELEVLEDEIPEDSDILNALEQYATELGESTNIEKNWWANHMADRVFQTATKWRVFTTGDFPTTEHEDIFACFRELERRISYVRGLRTENNQGE